VLILAFMLSSEVLSPPWLRIHSFIPWFHRNYLSEKA